MSKDVSERLSALAQDHREGRLTLATYRELRAPLLDALVGIGSGEADVATVTQPRAGIRAPEEAADPVAELLAPTKPRSRKGTMFSPKIVGLTVVVLAVGAAGWWVRQKFAALPVAGSTVVEVSGNSETSAAQRHIHEFLDRGDWTDERVDAFRFLLGESSKREWDEARESEVFRVLRDEVRKRFREQQALTAAVLTPQESPIAALAEQVGIDLKPAKAAPRAPASRTAAAKASAALPALPGATALNTGAGACKAEAIGMVCRDKLASGQQGPRLILVGAGTREIARADANDTGSAPSVSIKKSFAITVQGVSQAQFRRFCEDTFTPFPAQPRTGDDDPMVNVSWTEAREYLRWLSESTGQQYRLPSDDEWEFAAQLAKKSFSTGNVREWVETAWPDDESKRMARGALYADDKTQLLSDRVQLNADSRDALTGFRAVREL